MMSAMVASSIRGPLRPATVTKFSSTGNDARIRRFRYASPMTAHGAASDAGGWRELAIARSLDSARLRAETRVQRFLDAAIELMTAAPDREFTVQEVVERSGQSLRSFYQYFAGKHELLLAVFEESVRTTAQQLAESISS